MDATKMIEEPIEEEALDDVQQDQQKDMLLCIQICKACCCCCSAQSGTDNQMEQLWSYANINSICHELLDLIISKLKV